MKLAYLVDTDWVIDHLNGRLEVRQKLREFKPAGVGLSIISVAELYEGVHYSQDPSESERMLDMLLAEFPALPVDLDVCQVFGKERGRLRRDKKVVSDFDLLIASTCLRWNLKLLTNNRRHYGAVQGLEVISIS